MKAVILAAGRGSRLRPITDYIPKPLVPLQGKPLLEWILLGLVAYGIREYVIATSYLAEQIENYFGDGKRWGVEIAYSRGNAPAGKAGEVWRCRELLAKEPRFLVVPGDTLCQLDYCEFMDFHTWTQGVVSVALSSRYRLEVGVAEVDQANRITGFLEKANLDRPVSTGTYLLEQSIFPYIERFAPEQQEVDLPAQVFPVLLQEGKGVYGFVRDYAWWDIGRVNDYEAIAHLPPHEAQAVLAPGRPINQKEGRQT